MVLDTSPELQSAASDSGLPAEALFKEAKQRERRRRFKFGVVALVALALIATGIVWGTRGGTPPAPITPSEFVPRAVQSTLNAGSATFAFTYRNAIMGGCIPDTNVPVTRGHGTIDLSAHSADYAATTKGCREGTYTEKFRFVGGNVFEDVLGPRGMPRPGFDPNAKTWAEISTKGLFGDLRDIMTSAKPLSILQAAPHGWRVVDSGGAETEYANTISLAQLYREATRAIGPAAVLGNGSPVAPSADVIHISVRAWLDGAGRVVRISAAEPLFTAIYTDGGDEENAFQASTTAIDNFHPVTIRRLKQQGSFDITDRFSAFGTGARIGPPPRSQTAVSP
jgi:hypothetical protein